MPTLPSDNYFPVNSETYSSTLAGSISAGAATVPVNSSSPYLDGDVVVLTVDPDVSGKQATFTGVKSGSSYINCEWTEGAVGVGHDGGAVIKDYDSATHFGLVSKGMREEHNQDGTHGDIHADSLAVNTISEKTAANGVTVDGLNIKDGKLNTNNSVVTANITDANITTDKLADSAVTPAKMLGVDLLGRTAEVLIGTGLPAAGTGQFYMQAGTVTVTTNASGDTTIAFPEPFPNGILSIVVTNAGSLADLAIASAQTNGTLTGFNFSSNEKSGSVKFSWIAIGW